MCHPKRPRVIIKEAGAESAIVFIDAPASEDVLGELASVLQMRFLGVSSGDFLKDEDTSMSGVSAIVICPRTEMERSHSLRTLFASVRKARELFGSAPILTLLPLRDQMCEKDLRKYGCTVGPWEGFAVSKVASLIKDALGVTASKSVLNMEFRQKNTLVISNTHGSYELKLPGGRPPVLLRKLLQEDRAFSLIEIARALDCENVRCIKMSVYRLNKVFRLIPESLRITLNVLSAGYGKGYRLLISQE